MRIKNISCNQFAGVCNRNVSFTDGINVIYGKNESGKSTLVNLISRTLFQDVKLKMNTKEGKDFADLYLPGAKKSSGIAGDFADGKITFETENGTYTLSKEWGTDARCSLSTPDGIIRDQSLIEAILKDALLYGEGVYSDMLFSSQRNTDVSLQTILDASKSESKKEIADAVSQAFAESDGVSVDAIEQAIQTKIDEIKGKHWDVERGMPERKPSRWVKDLGEILKAYYAWEDAKNALAEISGLEQKADDAVNTYTDLDIALRTAEDAYNRFNTFASCLASQRDRKKVIERNNADLDKITDILSEWPQLKEDLERARELQTEKENRNVLDIWKTVQETQAELSGEDYAVAELPYPDNSEITKIKKLQREITLYENKLCGMNLNAAIHMLGGNELQIISLRTGENVDTTDGLASITEAVKITVPGVMEIQLSPADVDVAYIEQQIASSKQMLADIFAKYKVETLEELENYAQKIENTKAKIENVSTRLSRILGNMSFAQLEELYRQTDPVNRSKEEIEDDILAVCKSSDIATFITRTETVVDGYAAEYGSVNDLKVKALDLEGELEEAKKSVSGVENIPAEYLAIMDPYDYLDSLQGELKRKQSLRDDALKEKSSAATALKNYKDAHPEACQETVDKAERNFEEVQSLLNHWLHIAEVFKAQKENIHDNPMQDIADRFAHYLSIISGGRVSSEFPEADKLNVNTYSENNLLDYGKLSEGTKETVSLAFRLAVLDHLFPEGGGVIVFDDPFTDMDADRTAQSCELIKECATRHQVIFLTCKEDYLSILEGNHILF